MNLLGSGAAPLNSAPEKSNPGCSSANLSFISRAFSASSAAGSNIPCPLNRLTHGLPLWSLVICMCSSPSSRVQKLSAALTASVSSWCRYGGLPLMPNLTDVLVTSTSRIFALTPGGVRT